jgi:hypothetical protein
MAARRRVARGRGRLHVEDVPPDDVAHDGPPEDRVGSVTAEGMHVTVQEQRRREAHDELSVGYEPLVRRVVPVADTAGWRVREQHVDASVIAAPAPASDGCEPPGPPALLALRVLVRALRVAKAAAEPGQAKTSDVDDSTVGVHRPERPRWLVGHTGAQHKTTASLPVSVDVGIVVAGDEDKRHVQLTHETVQVVER